MRRDVGRIHRLPQLQRAAPSPLADPRRSTELGCYQDADETVREFRGYESAYQGPAGLASNGAVSGSCRRGRGFRSDSRKLSYRFCSVLEGVKTGIFLRREATALPFLDLNASGQVRRWLREGTVFSLLGNGRQDWLHHLFERLSLGETGLNHTGQRPQGLRLGVSPTGPR